MHRISFGCLLREVDFSRCANQIQELVQVAESERLDYLTVGDHVTFRDGTGSDGLIHSTALLSAGSTMSVRTGIYLLALRHPVLVARQLATLSQLAPGRFSFGIGVGGEDPEEFIACGIDPRTRGARTDESLRIVTELLTGDSVTFHGEFFHLDDVKISPAPAIEIPFLIGGRSIHALRRVAATGTGWIAVWVTPERFRDSVARIIGFAETEGRTDVPNDHTLHAWCRFGNSKRSARDALAPEMERLYGMPFEKFEKYSLYGTANDVAEGLAPFIEAGCEDFTLIPYSDNTLEAIRLIGQVRRIVNAAL